MQTLMAQAAWNLCPVSGVPSGVACYYADDQTFTDLSGTTTVVIEDCPDGTCPSCPAMLAVTTNRGLKQSTLSAHMCHCCGVTDCHTAQRAVHLTLSRLLATMAGCYALHSLSGTACSHVPTSHSSLYGVPDLYPCLYLWSQTK